MSTPNEWQDSHDTATAPLHPHVGHDMAVKMPPVTLAHEPVMPVPVTVVNAVATTTDADQSGFYSTFVVSTTLNAVANVAPYDPLRQYLYIYSVDQDVVITTVKEQAQAAANQVASVPGPQGAYLPKGTWTPAIRHNDPVYVAATSGTATRVTVLIERGGGDRSRLWAASR